MGLDLVTKLVTNFIKHESDMEDTTPSQLHSIPLPKHEGLQEDKPNTLDQHQIIPEYILPTHRRPAYHKLYLVRAVGYTAGPDGHLIKDPPF